MGDRLFSGPGRGGKVPLYMRNALLFIPAVIVPNHLWQPKGVIAAQPAVEAILAAVCLVMYAVQPPAQPDK